MKVKIARKLKVFSPARAPSVAPRGPMSLTRATPSAEETSAEGWAAAGEAMGREPLGVALGVAALFASTDCADLALDVGGGARIPAHSLVLHIRAPALLEHLRTGAGECAGSATITVPPDLSAAALGALLHYAYRDALPAACGGGVQRRCRFLRQ